MTKTYARGLVDLPNFEEWQWDAKCYGKDTSLWYSDEHGDLAQERCAGCPFSVMQRCAARALYYQDIGVIVAGVNLASDRGYNEKHGRYEALRKIVAGVRPQKIENLKTETIVPNEPIETIPGRHETRSFWLDGIEYVSSGGAAAIFGITETRLRGLVGRDELGLTKRLIRIHHAGPKSVYYRIEEVREAQEKRSGEREQAARDRIKAGRESRKRYKGVRRQRYAEQRNSGLLRGRAEDSLVENV